MLKGESSSLRLFLLGLLSLLHMHRVLGNVEVEALNAMKNALEDPGNVLHNWDTSLVDPCTWFRITCGQVIGEPDYKHVIQMQVWLSGTLVPNLQNLAHLQYLELFGNAIYGTIPEEFGKLSNLVSLDLYDNNLTGQISHTLGSYNHLRFMRLQNNTFTGIVPRSFITISTLQVLNVSENCIDTSVPNPPEVVDFFAKFGEASFANNPKAGCYI
ncbi:unnamed protein product [Cuscuta europaea]|uniref:Leucine-rich repeat-containing N-terminal plant-type domain-containing protein n=1 Tax=Cuscuta europaea TaxID=41803 RepID=A0A9P1DXZ7_CUSEU|nr:unnamed protein product [Cuscuta europaea]CAH9059013.1 unnamed protein product [Cuscuta europaea]